MAKPYNVFKELQRIGITNVGSKFTSLINKMNEKELDKFVNALRVAQSFERASNIVANTLRVSKTALQSSDMLGRDYLKTIFAMDEIDDKIETNIDRAIQEENYYRLSRAEGEDGFSHAKGGLPSMFINLLHAFTRSQTLLLEKYKALNKEKNAAWAVDQTLSKSRQKFRISIKKLTNKMLSLIVEANADKYIWASETDNVDLSYLESMIGSIAKDADSQLLPMDRIVTELEKIRDENWTTTKEDLEDSGNIKKPKKKKKKKKKSKTKSKKVTATKESLSTVKNKIKQRKNKQKQAYKLISAQNKKLKEKLRLQKQKTSAENKLLRKKLVALNKQNAFLLKQINKIKKYGMPKTKKVRFPIKKVRIVAPTPKRLKQRKAKIAKKVTNNKKMIK